MAEECGLYRVLLEYGKNVQLQSRKLNKRIESNGIQSVSFFSFHTLFPFFYFISHTPFCSTMGTATSSCMESLKLRIRKA